MMQPHIHLIVHNIICIISAVSTLGMAFFTYLNGPKKPENVTWTLMLLAIAVFVISHAIGVNITDPYASKSVLMFNLSVFFISAFNVHAFLILMGKDKEQKPVIVLLYGIALICTVFFILFPNYFLLPSVPKLYFPNYYNPGVLNWTRIVYEYGIVVVYMIYQLIDSIRKTRDHLRRTQYIYLLAIFSIGYAFGALPNFLVYNVPVDPAFGMLFVVLFAVPFVYGSVKYGLLNVKVIAIQAFWYSMAVAIVGGLITLFNYANNLIIQLVPSFPGWTISIGTSILMVSISVLIWRKLRESDLLKYEFITTVTHKFRTPLTHIKWASENLVAANLPESEKMQLDYITEANSKLVELTNLLMNVSEAENSAFEYKFDREDLSEIVNETITSLMPQFTERHVQLETSTPSGMYANFDPSRIRFIIQTFLENAIHYAPKDAHINITVSRSGSNIIVSIKDNGIGISRDELPLLFSKFYRGKQARLTDTEGMGIGLFIAKNVIEHHHGHIWAESAGPGTGSTFNFSLPAVQ